MRLDSSTRWPGTMHFSNFYSNFISVFSQPFSYQPNVSNILSPISADFGSRIQAIDCKTFSAFSPFSRLLFPPSLRGTTSSPTSPNQLPLVSISTLVSFSIAGNCCWLEAYLVYASEVWHWGHYLWYPWSSILKVLRLF